jgi:hypothetical protein
MKKILFLLFAMVLIGCDSPNGLDCFQSAGDLVQEEYEVDVFNKIQVWERVQLFISQGPVQSVRVETGDNLINEVFVRVKDSVLTVSDRNSCNFVRDYSVTKVYVTSPNIEEIRNSSGHTVESEGVLGFNELDLISQDPLLDGLYHMDGDFNLDLDVATLRIRANGLSKFYLRGKAGHANFALYDGDVRVEAAELEIRGIYFYHRSTNKIIINPLIALRGEIWGLGDVISLDYPPIIEVEEFFRGRLIFE